MTILTCGQICSSSGLVTANHAMRTSDVLAEMAKKRATAACIMRRGKLAGIFTMKDLMVKILGYSRRSVWRLPKRRKMRDVVVRAVMTPEPVCVTPGTPIVTALRLMQEKRIRHLPVIENDKPIAMLTLREVARAIAASNKEEGHFLIEKISSTWGREEALQLAPAIRAAAKRS